MATEIEGGMGGHKGMVETVARRFVVPLAIALDFITLVIRFIDVGMQVVLPDVYKAWTAHHNPVLSFFYYISSFVVIGGVAVGALAALYLAMPLIYIINKRIETASHIKNKKVKNERMKILHQKRERYTRYLWMLVGVVVLFFIPYVLDGLFGQSIFLSLVGSVAELAAPLIVLFVITQTEKEHDDVDAQERTMHTSTNIVVSQVRQIAEQFGGGDLTKRQAGTLKRGLDGDIEGMIDAAVPRDETQRMYTISDLCRKYGCDTDRDDPGRKQIYRIVTTAHENGELEIVKDPKRGWLVPGTLLDKLFGDWHPPEPVFRLVQDRRRTQTSQQPAEEAG